MKKSAPLAIGLFTFTALAVAFYPQLRQDPADSPAGISNGNPLISVISTPLTPTSGSGLPAANPETSPSAGMPVSEQNAASIEVVFVLDTTGSMGGLIQAAKDKIWSIASTMASAQQAPTIKMGLIAYRDRGDQYVTRVIDLSADLDSNYAALTQFEAGGGGDHPESVNQALYDAVHKISWSQDQNSYKVVFLVGDAPPHMDYAGEMQYPEVIALAKHKGIVVNTIQCGAVASTAQPWMQIAQLGQGQYFQVEQSGGAVAIATPYDRQIAELSAQLDATRLYYGNREEKAKKQARLNAALNMVAESSVSAQARRGEFNASASGKSNLLGDRELIDDLANKRVQLSDIEREHLPEHLQPMSPEARKTYLEDTAKKREVISERIQQFAQKRQKYIRSELEKSGDREESLDEKIYRALKHQAREKGLEYEADSARY